MNNGMKLGLSWTELLSMPLYVLNAQIMAASDEQMAIEEQVGATSDDDVRDANQDDIKGFI